MLTTTFRGLFPRYGPQRFLQFGLVAFTLILILFGLSTDYGPWPNIYLPTRWSPFRSRAHMVLRKVTASGEVLPVVEIPLTPTNPSATLAHIRQRLVDLSPQSSRELYQLEEQLGQLDVTPLQCGNAWQADYSRLHARLRRDLEQGRPARALVSSAMRSVPGFGFSGGMGDRLKGIVQTFVLSLVLDRAFFIYWEEEDPVGYSAVQRYHLYP